MKYTVTSVTTFEVREDVWNTISKHSNEEEAYRAANVLNVQHEKAVQSASKEVQKTLDAQKDEILKLKEQIAEMLAERSTNVD